MTSSTHPSVPPPSLRSALPTGFRLGHVRGIEIRMDPSIVVIGLLVSMNLAQGLLPAWHPSWSHALVWFVAILAAALFFASILAHELAHAFVGRRLGLPTRRITLFIFGGMAELDREPDRPKVELLTAAAGPLLSVALGGAALIGGGLLARTEAGGAFDESSLHRLGPLTTLLLWLGPVNLFLGAFNLVPGFPLDGGRVLRAIIWWKTKRFDRATRWAARCGQLVAGLLVAAGVMMMFGYRIPVLGSGFGQGLWLLLIGWFLNAAALRSYAQSLFHRR